MEDEPPVAPRPRKRSISQVEAAEVNEKNGAKTAHIQDEDSSSEDDDIGPALPSDAPKKKRRKLPYEKLYISALPASTRYSKSLMHREQLSFATMTPFTDFLVTSSTDGVVKFWKKVAVSIEFAKEFKAHQGEIRGVSVSADGRSFATAGVDRTIKVFDVITFDLLFMLQLEFVPNAICWIHKRGASLPLLAVSEEESPKVHIFDGRGGNEAPIHTLPTLHRAPVSIIAYNPIYDCCISADTGGMLEYWSPSTFEKPSNVFQYKSSTSLFAFKKAKSRPSSLSISPTGQHFVTFSFPDRQIRLFDFASATITRTYDESLSTLQTMRQAGTDGSTLSELEFNRRMALENTLDTAPSLLTKANVIFDESGHFILFGSLHGTKVLNTYTNRVVRTYGAEEPFRPLHLALYQGAPQQKEIVTVSMAASSNPLLQDAEMRDPILVATGLNKVRFYLFTNEAEITKSTRDIQNEKPLSANASKPAKAQQAESGTAAVLHTTYGDIHLRLYPSLAPKTVENFVTHSRNGYYNNTIFHRVIRKFMIQGGDPNGDGTGGESIWGGEFEDEITERLRHDRPYTVSMANAGPGTNGSQFFITTERTPWLDDKHTIFGRAIQGLDVVHKIENAKAYKEKPEEDIKIINISIN